MRCKLTKKDGNRGGNGYLTIMKTPFILIEEQIQEVIL